MDSTTGIILNDEMDDFSTPGKINAFGLKPSPFNYPEPGKRPLSSTAASIVEYADGTLYTAIGGSGGSRIFGAVAQVIFNMDWGMDVMNAIEAPRLHDQLFPATVTLETGKRDSLISGGSELANSLVCPQHSMTNSLKHSNTGDTMSPCSTSTW
jgi:gamma-glutamyltranspeptidase/glutathione hydrolase/leukotriene-C4 hydrolase